MQESLCTQGLALKPLGLGIAKVQEEFVKCRLSFPLRQGFGFADDAQCGACQRRQLALKPVPCLSQRFGVKPVPGKCAFERGDLITRHGLFLFGCKYLDPLPKLAQECR